MTTKPEDLSISEAEAAKAVADLEKKAAADAAADIASEASVSLAGSPIEGTADTQFDDDFDEEKLGDGENESQPSDEALKAENTKLRDQALRLMADMENLRRRTEREKSDMASYAISNFARDVLNIADNLDRAVSAVPDDKLEDDPALKALNEGVLMTRRELINTLDRYDVKEIAAQGERFDPNLHQAMFELDNPDVPAGTVVQVMAPGFAIGERILRPAMVGVSKGGPKEVLAPENDTKADDNASVEILKPAAPPFDDPTVDG